MDGASSIPRQSLSLRPTGEQRGFVAPCSTNTTPKPDLDVNQVNAHACKQSVLRWLGLRIRLVQSSILDDSPEMASHLSQ